MFNSIVFSYMIYPSFKESISNEKYKIGELLYLKNNKSQKPVYLLSVNILIGLKLLFIIRIFIFGYKVFRPENIFNGIFRGLNTTKSMQL